MSPHSPNLRLLRVIRRTESPPAQGGRGYRFENRTREAITVPDEREAMENNVSDSEDQIFLGAEVRLMRWMRAPLGIVYAWLLTTKPPQAEDTSRTIAGAAVPMESDVPLIANGMDASNAKRIRPMKGNDNEGVPERKAMCTERRPGVHIGASGQDTRTPWSEEVQAIHMRSHRITAK